MICSLFLLQTTKLMSTVHIPINMFFS
uniref:Uncharacterized protein n=1 Tax=Arundo donax TaxID=35708 RepID=A0A0A9EBR6_ARUDO